MINRSEQKNSVSPREMKLKVNGKSVNPERIAEDLTAMAISVPAGIIAGVVKATVAAVKKAGLNIELEK